MNKLLFIAIFGIFLKGFAGSGVDKIRTTNQTRFYHTENEGLFYCCRCFTLYTMFLQFLDTLGCPSWNEIPDKFDDQFVCAVNYNGIGGDYEVNACNGNLKCSEFLAPTGAQERLMSVRSFVRS